MGQKTHFTAKLIATIQLIHLGCTSQWQSGTSPCKSVWVCQKARGGGSFWWQGSTGHKIWNVSPLCECGQRAAKGKRQVGRRKYLHVWSLDQCTPHKHWLSHFPPPAPLLPGNDRLAAKCLPWAVWSQARSRCLARGRSLAQGNGCRPLVWAVSLFITQSRSATNASRSQQPVAPLQAALEKELDQPVLWTFLQALAFSSAEQSSSASPCQSCAPLPATPGTSAFLPTLLRKTGVYSLHLPVSPPGFDHFEELWDESVMQSQPQYCRCCF